MSVQNPERVVTKQDLADFYTGIYPYLNGGSGGGSGGGTTVELPKIPEMTSDTTPSGEASASTTYTNQPAYKAFNGIANDPWAMANGDSNPWLQYSFGQPVKATAIGYDFYTVPERVTSFSLYGDGNLITTITGPITSGFHKVDLPSDKQGNYSVYKLTFVATGLVHVDTFQVYAEEEATSPTNYSNAEQLVGIFTNGKPIYQKTFAIDVTLAGSSWSWYGTGIVAADYDIDKIVDAELLTVDNLPHTALGWHLTYQDSSISFISYWPGTNITTMTLRYTKTTD